MKGRKGWRVRANEGEKERRREGEDACRVGIEVVMAEGGMGNYILGEGRRL